MRLVTIRAPKGNGQKLAEIAFQAQIAQVAFHEVALLPPGVVRFPGDHLMHSGSWCVIGLIMEPHIKFTEFSSPPLTSFLFALAIAIAAGLGSIDDAGRRTKRDWEPNVSVGLFQVANLLLSILISSIKIMMLESPILYREALQSLVIFQKPFLKGYTILSYIMQTSILLKYFLHESKTTRSAQKFTCAKSSTAKRLN